MCSAADSVERISALKERHNLPVIGMSYGGAMWDRTQHAKLLEESNLIIPRLEKLGGKTLGTSVGASPRPKTKEQLDAQAEFLRTLIAPRGPEDHQRRLALPQRVTGESRNGLRPARQSA